MSDRRPGFREEHPTAWQYHRNTSYSGWCLPDVPGDPYNGGLSREDLEAATIPLPQSALPAATLARAIRDRVSCRQFSAQPLSLDSLAVLLGGGYGVLGRKMTPWMELMPRPVPSGGGLYPLELRLLVHRVDGLAAAQYHYLPLTHSLELGSNAVIPGPELTRIFFGQEWLPGAAAVLVICGVPERSMWKYGDRGYRYLLFEAGHVAQNVNLLASALGLASCNLGGFLDVELARCLGLDAERELPLYGVALGHRAG